MANFFATASQIRAQQWERLRDLLAMVVPANSFYTQKFAAFDLSLPLSSWDDFSRVPFTTKLELVQDQLRQPPFGSNLTFPLDHYSRFHQTSGTTGKPLRWLDTAETWSALIDNWVAVYETAGVTRSDRIFFAFSFGPFLGFWLAFEAGARLGAMCLPAGGVSTQGRLQMILENKATVLCCTPTYALHLAEVAAHERIDLSKSSIRLIIVAGEAGGSLPSTRALLEKQWPKARVFDHHGMTETGPITYECPAQCCRLHVIDSTYIAEVIDPVTGQPVPPGREGELVITNLHRVGSPLIRYRTGDLVKLAPDQASDQSCVCGRFETTLQGGILGRSDDMVIVRGVNIYPTAVEQIVRSFPEVAEYQVRISRKGALTQMHIILEPLRSIRDVADVVARVEAALQTALTLRIPVTAVPDGSLPRAELKAKRWLIETSK
jgi:phenylacetate-CoA ligase